MCEAMAQQPMLIAGGGIAGLSAALGLARMGRPSIVMESAQRFEAAGAGLQLGPNAVRALQWLGAWETVAPAAFAPPAIVIRDGASGHMLARIPLGSHFERRFGQPYRVAHRADLLDALVAAAGSSRLIELRTGCPVDPHAPIGGAGLIGADGLNSAVRQRIAPGVHPCFRGQSIFRALAPMAELPTAVCLWLCPAGHIVHYPVSGGRLNIVATVAGGRTSERWSESAEADAVMHPFRYCCRELHDILAKPARWQRWAAVDLPRLASWHGGGAVLIGDAAHAALPYLAQGAAMALEDAVVLSLCLGTRSDRNQAFAAYEAARIARTTALADASRRLAGFYHARGPLRLARNGLLRLMTPDRFLDRLAWIYAYDPLRRSSSVSE